MPVFLFLIFSDNKSYLDHVTNSTLPMLRTITPFMSGAIWLTKSLMRISSPLTAPILQNCSSVLHILVQKRIELISFAQAEKLTRPAVKLLDTNGADRKYEQKQFEKIY